MPKSKTSLQWPPDYLSEYNRRYRNRNRLMHDADLRKHVMAHYAHHPVEWINDWCMTFDPRNQRPLPSLLPFKLFPRQEEFIQFVVECIDTKEHGLIEKSRDMGATWLCAAISAWLWIFRSGSVIGWGSRKESYVDKIGDPKAVFPKIRQILDNLPSWMLPEGYKPSVHAGYMRIVNPQNLCAIIGEAGDSMGRGGRTTVYFKDESAHYERPDLIEAALGDNTDVQIDMSSVNGTANVFYRRRKAGVLWYPGHNIPSGKTRVFVFDWREHPAKTQKWYDMRRKKAEEEGLLHAFSQEVDRDYAASVQGVIIPPAWVRSAIDAHIKLGFPVEGTIAAGQDVADGGGDRNALVVRKGVVCIFADHWGGDAGDAAVRAIPQALELGAESLDYDSVGVGAGFKTQANTMRKEGKIGKLKITPWNGGGEVHDPDKPSIPGDKESPTNKEQYYNLKAQSYFRLRSRFNKTYRAITYGETYHPSELISLDSRMEMLHQLTEELSQPVQKDSPDRKFQVDKKPNGAVSPNLADAFCICFNPITKPKGFFSM